MNFYSKPKTLALLVTISCISPIFCKKNINDFSNLNKTVVNKIYYPSTEREIQHIIKRATKQGKKVSIAGKYHSQGGHAFYDDALLIDIRKFNNILKLDTKKKIITVQTGATWEQIQEHINPHKLAIKVMQTTQIFTVGGSLSVNAHGRDPNYGTLIETIKKIKILLASGEILEASREKNYELFKLAIGGYGLFGFILEADIELTDNTVYKKTAQIIKVTDYEKFIEKQILQNPKIGLHYGIISLSPYDFFKKMIAVNYNVADERPSRAYELEQEKFVFFSQIGLHLKRESRLFNLCSEIGEWPTVIMREKLPHKTCRNNAMRHPAKCLEPLIISTKNTDVLQSYFIPVNEFVDFMKYLSSCAHQETLKIIYAFTRYIPKSTESFLSYANNDCLEVVIYVNQETSLRSVQQAKLWTQKVVKKVLSYNGCYYLPVKSYPTQKQLEQAYPQIHDFFTHKLFYDPKNYLLTTFTKNTLNNINSSFLRTPIYIIIIIINCNYIVKIRG